MSPGEENWPKEFPKNPPAVFCPNCLHGMVPVVVNGNKCLASHNLAVHCHEIRNFIDAEFLKNDLGLLCPPEPPLPVAKQILGHGMMSAVVKGMLAIPLNIEFEGMPLSVSVQRVLVVDPLPVPLHISARSFLESIDTPEMRREFLDYFIKSNIKLTVEEVPVKNRLHEFWHTQNNFIGFAPGKVMTHWTSVLKSFEAHTLSWMQPSFKKRKIEGFEVCSRPRAKASSPLRQSEQLSIYSVQVAHGKLEELEDIATGKQID